MTPELVNFDQLRETFPRLYRTLVKDTCHVSGICPVDMVALSDFTRGELSQWLESQREPAPKPVAVVETEPLPPQIDMGEVLREEQAALQRAADQTRATQRLNEWAAGGLEDTQLNANLIKGFVQAEVKGYFSREIIDVAIQRLGPRGTNQLTWQPKVEPAPPPAEPAAEVLGTLADGTKQLPLDADEYVMRRASVKQILDLNLRRRKATNQMVVGKNHRGFGTTF